MRGGEKVRGHFFLSLLFVCVCVRVCTCVFVWLHVWSSHLCTALALTLSR